LRKESDIVHERRGRKRLLTAAGDGLRDDADLAAFVEFFDGKPVTDSAPSAARSRRCCHYGFVNSQMFDSRER